MTRSRTTILCILLASVAGCERESEPAGLPQSRFIEAMVELRKAARGVQDTAAFAARRQQVLADAGVTEAQLRAYLTTHIRDLDHLAAVWESINVRLSEEEPR
jgi:GTPase